MTDQAARPGESDARLADLMNRLKTESEKRGWHFFIQPSPNMLPHFLQGHRPDALGIGADGGVVVEIEAGRSGIEGRPSLADLAKLVEAQKGWELRVFYVSPLTDQDLSLPYPTAGELASGITEARTLLDTGHERAALVMAWSLIEAIARLVTPRDERARAQPSSPIQAVQTLAEMGYLEETDARRLRDLTHLRNAVVHGGLGIVVPADDVAQLIRDLERITNNLVEAA